MSRRSSSSSGFTTSSNEESLAPNCNRLQSITPNIADDPGPSRESRSLQKKITRIHKIPDKIGVMNFDETEKNFLIDVVTQAKKRRLGQQAYQRIGESTASKYGIQFPRKLIESLINNLPKKD